jgi:hypothetical protein
LALARRNDRTSHRALHEPRGDHGGIAREDGLLAAIGALSGGAGTDDDERRERGEQRSENQLEANAN